MPRLVRALPAYQKHRASGQAVITLSGRDIYLGRGEVTTGLLMTPWPLLVMVTAPIAGRLSDRFSAGLLGGIGLGVFGLGLGLTALLPAHPADAEIVWRLAICGAGFGLFQSPNNRAIIGSAPRNRSGGANGMLGLARLSGQTLGATIAALVFKLFPHHGQMPVALGVACALAVVGMVFSFLRLRVGAPATTSVSTR